VLPLCGVQIRLFGLFALLFWLLPLCIFKQMYIWDVGIQTEDDGRMFPVSDSSSTVVNCLLSEALKNEGIMHFSSPYESLQYFKIWAGNCIFYL